MRRGIAQLVAIGVVIAVLLTVVAVVFQWLPTSASEEFDRIQDVYWMATIISIGIFSVVLAVVIYAVWKWRVPLDDDQDGPPIHGNTGLEIAWTAVPAILVIAIGIVSAVVLARNGEAGNRPLEVNVVGQQFTWKFVYTDYDNLTDRRARASAREGDAVHDDRRGCHPLLLGSELRSEDGCRSGDRDDDSRDADAGR